MNASTASIVPSATDKLDRLKALLREMFQLDRGDLDFGLYRIMNLKTAEITAFLDNNLLPQVKEALEGLTGNQVTEIEEELKQTIETLRGLKVDPDKNEVVQGLRTRLAEAKRDADAEADVYNHLANFFFATTPRATSSRSVVTQAAGGRLTLSLTTARKLSCTGPTRINTTSRRRQIMRPMSSLPVNGVCAWRLRRQITRGTM